MAPSEQLEEFNIAVIHSYDTFASKPISARRPGPTKDSSWSTGHGQAAAAPSSASLTKAELAILLFEQVGLNKREAKDIIDAFFDEINSALVRGESVKLTSFGNFQLRDKASRPGRNPKTGIQVQIPARRVVTFHASQKLKEMVDCSAPSTPYQHDER